MQWRVVEKRQEANSVGTQQWPQPEELWDVFIRASDKHTARTPMRIIAEVQPPTLNNF